MKGVWVVRVGNMDKRSLDSLIKEVRVFREVSILNVLTSCDLEFGVLCPLRSTTFVSWSHSKSMRSRWCCREGSEASEALDHM